MYLALGYVTSIANHSVTRVIVALDAKLSKELRLESAACLALSHETEDVPALYGMWKDNLLLFVILYLI